MILKSVWNAMNQFSPGGLGALCQACPRTKPYTKGEPGKNENVLLAQ